MWTPYKTWTQTFQHGYCPKYGTPGHYIYKHAHTHKQTHAPETQDLNKEIITYFLSHLRELLKSKRFFFGNKLFSNTFFHFFPMTGSSEEFG